jgi:hypothetical protein
MPKPRNCHGNFGAEITKSQLPILGPKPKKPEPPVLRPNRRKPSPPVLRPNHLQTVDLGFKAQPRTPPAVLRHLLCTYLNLQARLEQLKFSKLTHQCGHKQMTPCMQGLKGELYHYAKSALEVSSFFYNFNHGAKFIRL